MTTLLVTGGLGFIGSNFIHRYLWKNPTHSVVNIDNFGFAANPFNVAGLKHCHTINCDINDQPKVAQIFNDFEPYSVVHFAAESHVDRSINSSTPFIISNVLGTHSLIQVANDYNRFLSEMNRNRGFVFIHVSTDEVYGSLRLGQRPTLEDDAYAPNSPYAASKAASDHIVRSFVHTHNFPALTTHCSNNYGPRQHREKFLPTVISSLIEGKKVPVYGNGSNIRDWIYVDDHNDALMELLKFGIPGQVYNIGGNCEVDNLTLARKVAALMGHNPDEAIEFVKDRPGHDFRYALNTSKLTKEINWLPDVNLEEGLELTIEYYKGFHAGQKQNENIGHNPSGGELQPPVSSDVSSNEATPADIR